MRFAFCLMTRPTWAEIHLDRLACNLQSVKNYVGDKYLKFMAVVKANAYGHCAVECARKLETDGGVDWFGVALPEEGIELREAKIQKPILCLGSFWEGQEQQILQFNLTPTIFRLEIAEALDFAARERGIIADVHIKIDTGMNRVGVRFDEIKEFAEGLRRFKNLKVDGLMTHFAAADGNEQFTNLQIEKFNEAVEIFHEKGFRPTFLDLANSHGTIGFPQGRGNMVRLGGIIYGLWWDSEKIKAGNAPQAPKVLPVMTLHTKIAFLKNVPKGESLGYSRSFTLEKDSLIATIPIGYEDGYSRGLSNRGRVLVNGIYAPVVGRVSMDWTIIDVSEVPEIKIGDEVVLIGEQGGLRISAEEVAQHLETISLEVTCGINRRVKRVFKDQQKNA